MVRASIERLALLVIVLSAIAGVYAFVAQAQPLTSSVVYIDTADNKREIHPRGATIVGTGCDMVGCWVFSR